MRSQLLAGVCGMMFLSASAGAQSVELGHQTSQGFASGDGFAFSTGHFDGEFTGVVRVDEHRLQTERAYLTAHAKSLADLMMLAKKCRRIVGPPSYCDLPVMQQLAWAKEQ